MLRQQLLVGKLDREIAKGSKVLDILSVTDFRVKMLSFRSHFQ